MAENTKDKISLKDYTFQRGGELVSSLIKVRRCITDMMGELAAADKGEYLMLDISESLFTLNHLIEDVEFTDD